MENNVELIKVRLSKHRAISASVLAYDVGCYPIEVEEAIEELQLTGFPVVETPEGYTVATTKRQIMEYREKVLNPLAHRLVLRMRALAVAARELE